jgi:hypothetical protein
VEIKVFIGIKVTVFSASAGTPIVIRARRRRIAARRTNSNIAPSPRLWRLWRRWRHQVQVQALLVAARAFVRAARKSVARLLPKA